MTIQFRRGTAASASSNNPVLAAGEPGYETDTGVVKVGDGVNTWTALPAINGGGGGGGVTDHGALTGLTDDDHPQYHTDARAVPNTSYNAKGDIVVGEANDSPSLLSVGADDTLLVADSAYPLGVRWRRIYTTDLWDVSTFMQNFLVAFDESDARGFIGAAPATQTLNAQTGTSYTLVADDAGKLVTLTNAGAITLTVPSGVFSAGQRVDVAQRGAGAVTVVGSGVTVNPPPGLSLVAEGQTAYFSIVFFGPTEADVVGMMAAP